MTEEVYGNLGQWIEIAVPKGRSLVGLVLLLKGHHLLLELRDNRQLGIHVGLLLRSCLLVSLDLLHGASALGADLEHVGGNPLGNCNLEQKLDW